MTTHVEMLVTICRRALELQDHANAPAGAADDVVAEGNTMAAEQHYAFSRSYRKAAAEKQQEAIGFLKMVATQGNPMEPARIKNAAEREACARHYGSIGVGDLRLRHRPRARGRTDRQGQGRHLRQAPRVSGAHSYGTSRWTECAILPLIGEIRQEKQSGELPKET